MHCYWDLSHFHCHILLFDYYLLEARYPSKKQGVKKEEIRTCNRFSYLLFHQPFLLEDAKHLCRSQWSLEFLTIKHLLFQFFNGLNIIFKKERETYLQQSFYKLNSSFWKQGSFRHGKGLLSSAGWPHCFSMERQLFSSAQMKVVVHKC